jgi:hypothetical protein
VNYADLMESWDDVLSYGRHSPLGRTLDVTEERDPESGYIGRHSAEAIGGCKERPDECSHRCEVCEHHMCICPKGEDR